MVKKLIILMLFVSNYLEELKPLGEVGRRMVSGFFDPKKMFDEFVGE